jgi:hypothetical protein
VGPTSIEHDFFETFCNEVCRKTTIDEEESDSIVAEIDGLSWLVEQRGAGALNEEDFLGAALAGAAPLAIIDDTTTARATRSVERRRRPDPPHATPTEPLVISFILKRCIAVLGRKRSANC